MAVIRWFMRGLVTVLFLAAAFVFFMAIAKPGTVTSYLTNDQGLGFMRGQPVASADPLAPARRFSGIEERTRAEIARQKAQAQAQQQAAARAAAEDSQTYSPPTAQRKTVRVGE